jgi:hypothetical protein
MSQSRVLALLPALFVFTCGDALAQSENQVPATGNDTQLEDVVVTGTGLEEQAEAFVSSVGGAVRGRKLATWSEPLCVGAAGMAAEPAGAMVDRVLDWADSLGLRIGGPDCDPNILIVFTDDGDRTARELVRARPRDFLPGVSSSHRGRSALREFQTSGQPVRWWHLSLPVDPDTRATINRQRGTAPLWLPKVFYNPAELGAYGQMTTASRIYDDTLDAMKSVVVVIDAAALERTSFTQLSDYVAMIALAQIDPETRPTAPSILDIFETGMAGEETLTDWDQAFLQALYTTHQRNALPGADSSLIARSLARRLQERADIEQAVEP